MEVTSIGELFIFSHSFPMHYSHLKLLLRVLVRNTFYFAYKSLATAFYLEHVNFINGQFEYSNENYELYLHGHKRDLQHCKKHFNNNNNKKYIK